MLPTNLRNQLPASPSFKIATICVSLNSTSSSVFLHRPYVRKHLFFSCALLDKLTVAATEGQVKERAGLTLPEFGGKDNPKYNYGPANSAEKGVTRLLINTEAKSFTLSQAIYEDEESIVAELRKNEQSNSAPKKKP